MTAPFLWGAATSPLQTEGNAINSDWWATESHSSQLEPSGDAVDSYHHYREDMRLLAEAGLTAYRFGIEWARIEPAPGQFSLAELAHYRRMIDTAREFDLTPVITLHHFTSPQWFVDEGGWMGPTALDRFLAYTTRATDILGDVEWIATINEPNILAVMVNARQAFSAGDETIAGENFVMPRPGEEPGRRLIEIHQATRDALRARTDAKVGWTVAGQAFFAGPGAEDRLLEERYLREDLYYEGSIGDDFVGVQSYHTQEIGPDGPIPHPSRPGDTQSGPFTPEALAICIRHAWERTNGAPVLVTENGLATLDDTRRIEFIQKAVEGLQQAKTDGIDVLGYLYWTLLDSYEWGRWDYKFGLIEVDRMTFARRAKPSLAWFGEFARRQQA